MKPKAWKSSRVRVRLEGGFLLLKHGGAADLVEVFEHKLFVDGIPTPNLHPLGRAQYREDVGPLLLGQTLDLTSLCVWGGRCDVRGVAAQTQTPIGCTGCHLETMRGCIPVSLVQRCLMQGGRGSPTP